MNEAERVVTEPEHLLLESVYLQAKITGHALLNFTAIRSGLTHTQVLRLSAELERKGLLQVEKYGILRMTEKGKAYLRRTEKSATLSVGE